MPIGFTPFPLSKTFASVWKNMDIKERNYCAFLGRADDG